MGASIIPVGGCGDFVVVDAFVVVVVVAEGRFRAFNGLMTRELIIVVGDVSKKELVDSDPFIGSILLVLLLWIKWVSLPEP
jgi:hypothetical protein